jgi:hypothetical protein
MSAIDPEELIKRLSPWLSEEYLPWFRTGLSWGLPRCRTEEEKRLYPFLLIAFSPYRSTVTPRKLAEGNRMSFQATISRNSESGPVRLQIGIVCDCDAPADSDLDETLRLPRALVLSEPWLAAQQAASTALARLFRADGDVP